MKRGKMLSCGPPPARLARGGAPELVEHEAHALLQLLAPARFVLPERALREGALVLQSVLQLELPRAKLLALPPERLVVRQRLRAELRGVVEPRAPLKQLSMVLRRWAFARIFNSQTQFRQL